METIYIVRYGELFLKSEFVMKRMIRLLIRDVKTKMRENKIEGKIKKERGRIYVKAPDEIENILFKTFGIVSFSPAVKLSVSELDEYFRKNAKTLLTQKESFAIRVRRVGEHEFTSKEMEEKLGKIVQEETDAKVDLKHPDKTIFVEIRNNDAYVYEKIYRGVGGLPASACSKLLVLISSGIDSPVAAWLMAKRGASLSFLHFLRGSYGLSDREKTVQVVKKLREWYPFKVSIYFLDHSQNLSVFIKYKPYTCVLCKRMMLRLASILAREAGALGIVTGDSLGEVASQTLENLKVESSASSLPIYRPLIGMDKKEIISLAKRIGTYDLSISPKDFCTAVPRKPKTKAAEEEIEEIERGINIKKLVSETLKTLDVVKI